MISPRAKKKFDIPTIDPEDMTPQIAALVAFVEEMSRLNDEAYEERSALRKELAQLQRAKKRARRSKK